MFQIDLEKDYLTRFDMGKFISYNSESGYDILDSEFVDELPSLPTHGKYIVSSFEVGRLDSISYKIYGSTQFWWILLLYNGYSSVDEVTVGTSLNYPSLLSLENLVFRLK